MIVLDTGVLIAAVDADDQHHEPCARLLSEGDERFIVPAGVVVEVCWMLGRRVSVDAETEFLRSLADGGLPVESLTGPDYQRVAELVDTYRDLPLGSVDAMVVAVAERLNVHTIATVDRRDFTGRCAWVRPHRRSSPVSCSALLEVQFEIGGGLLPCPAQRGEETRDGDGGHEHAHD